MLDHINYKQYHNLRLLWYVRPCAKPPWLKACSSLNSLWRSCECCLALWLLDGSRVTSHNAANWSFISYQKISKNNPPRAYGKARSTIFRFCFFFERDELKHDIRNWYQRSTYYLNLTYHTDPSQYHHLMYLSSQLIGTTFYPSLSCSNLSKYPFVDKIPPLRCQAYPNIRGVQYCSLIEPSMSSMVWSLCIFIFYMYTSIPYMVNGKYSSWRISR